MFNPMVSIIIPVYNGANYLAEAIDSALAQTYKNIEIIVVNDGSTDDGATERVALSYGDKIRYFHKVNGGVSSALNLGICEMRGEYFSWLSHDDMYAPEKVETQVKLIETDKDIVLCSGGLVDENANPIFCHRRTLDMVLTGTELFEQVLKQYGLNGLGFLVPKHVFDKAGLFDESMRYLQDLDMWLRMMWYDYRFICHSDLLVMTRVHRKQLTNTGKDIYLKDSNAMAQKHMALISESDICEREKLIELYYLFYIMRRQPIGLKAIRLQAKKMKLSHKFYIKAIIFWQVGLLKVIYRKIKRIIFKLKKRRD